MSDPTGAGSGLGIEAVEWFAEGGENLTVRVTGRWRRGRPTWTGSALLVIEAHGRRHRFPAIPEPPSLSGPAPGSWRMSFSVPAALAPYLRSSAWLKLGVIVMPLPAAVEAVEAVVSAEETRAAAEDSVPGEEPPAEPEPPRSEARPPPAPPPARSRPSVPSAADAGTLAERRLRSAELALEATRARLADADDLVSELSGRIEQLEGALAQARGEPERLNALLAERERRRRSAEQRAFAERALREELEEELAERERELSVSAGAREALVVLQKRVEELERELDEVRRRADEAEQVAAAARVARERAELELTALRELGDRGGRGPGGPQLASAFKAELDVARRSSAASGTTERPRPPRPPARELALERQMVAAMTRAEGHRAARQAAEARAERLERQLEEQATRVLGAYEALEGLRGELEAVRLEHARELLTTQRTGPIDPGRLAAALVRLREAAPLEGQLAEVPEDVGPAPAATAAATAWLVAVFRALTRSDPVAAGLLAVRLLPALPLVRSEPLAFDLVLAELGCLQVTVSAGAVAIEPAAAPRGRGAASFQLTGDVQSLARLLAAGRIRRRLSRRVARVDGDRAGLAALLELIRAPLSLAQIHAAGVKLDPTLALTVVSLMVKPAWTKGHRFTIAHQEPGAPSAGTYLHVRDGEAVSVAHQTPLGPVATTIVGPADRLLPLLDGLDDDEVVVHGEPQPLATLRDWVKRAQSG
jgi:hypothetical protein